MPGGYRNYDLTDVIRTINSDVQTALSPDVTDQTLELINQIVNPTETMTATDAASVTAITLPGTSNQWGHGVYGTFTWT